MRIDQQVLVVAALASFFHRSEKTAPGAISQHIHIDWKHTMGPRLYYRRQDGELMLFAAWAGRELFHLERYCITQHLDVDENHVFWDLDKAYSDTLYKIRDVYSNRVWEAERLDTTLAESLFTQSLRGIA
jgi:hypothetical protein